MSNSYPIKINYSIKVHVFQEGEANIYILAPNLLLNHSRAVKLKLSYRKHFKVSVIWVWIPTGSPQQGGITLPRSLLAGKLQPVPFSEESLGADANSCLPSTDKTAPSPGLCLGWQELLQVLQNTPNQTHQTVRKTGACIPALPFAISTDGPKALYSDPLQLLN